MLCHIKYLLNKNEGLFYHGFNFERNDNYGGILWGRGNCWYTIVAMELIQEIQKKRQLSVIYITHDLGVVAKVADYVNVMYAGKIVESGTVEDVFYDPRHPYTWGLLSAMPDLGTDDERLYTIPGSPPNLLHKVTGDAFAPRNKYALNIDSRLEPPMFKLSD